uniref:MULE transposase domain-containing protein n=1 Tax=Romanomermis culicivorax TaxID=13658 RepID=A0A915K203_ROMCU
MDATHGTNQKKLLLITVLVLDDTRRGLPVAWFLCNQENEQSL